MRVGRLTRSERGRQRGGSSTDGVSNFAGASGYASSMTRSPIAPTLALAALLSLALPAVARGAPSATGDFDGDGRSDLAVGAPMDSVAGREDAGAVNVIYGSRRGGLREDPDQQFTQGTGGIQGWVDAHDRFGGTLAAGDFDGDGYGDLAIGSPGEDASGHANTGVVHVLYGDRHGLTRRDELLGQGFAGVPGTPEDEQNFGAALAAGDFDGNGRDDLAVGIPHDTVNGAPAAGAAVVMYSTRRGVIPGRDQVWTQDTPGIEGLAAAYHRFGGSLAAGDLDDDARTTWPSGSRAGASTASAAPGL
jgi:FG-GAP repeat